MWSGRGYSADMTGRHAHASGKAASGTGLWLVQGAAIVVGILLALAGAAVVCYYLFTDSDVVAAFGALSLVSAAILIRNVVRKRGAFWPWFLAGFLLSTISQLITQLSHRHQWLAGHLHRAAQLSDWAEWTGLALVGIAVVLGIRSGELLFWKRSG
jgi:uncharacterized membrane protein HdeD (DUF308 family)